MELVIQPNADRAACLVARLIAQAIREKPHIVLGLATGRTMERVYRCLVQMHKHHGLDFSLCRTFNLDEYIGLPADSPFSYRYYMNKHLFSQVNIDRRNTYLPDGMNADTNSACRHYESLIQELGGIDLQLLGIGAAGHIGFNEPLSALQSRTREKALTPTTIADNAPLCGGDPDKMPRRAINHGRRHHPRSPKGHSSGHRDSQGQCCRQGGRRPDYFDDFGLGSAIAPPLPRGGRRRSRREPAGQGLLPLDIRERAGVDAIPYPGLRHRRLRAVQGLTCGSLSTKRWEPPA